MATFTVTWVPTNGSTYEIWYGKLTEVGTTSLPPTTGWTEALGSPFDSTLGTATISGLDDNTQYRVVSRADCGANDSPWVERGGYKLVCPTFSVVADPVPGDAVGASISATVNLSNLVEFEIIASSVTLTVKKTSDSSIVATKVWSTPYTSSTLTNTFANLLTGTSYTVYLSIHDTVAGTDIACSNQPVTTNTPVVVPPPVCNAPTFSVGNITASGFVITVTSSSIPGDTYDVSTNGGTFWSVLGQTSPISVTGLTANTPYVVMVRRNCVGGGQGVSTSQTISTGRDAITGSITIDAAAAVGQSPIKVTVNLQQPLTDPLTLYFGYTWKNLCNTCPGQHCSWSNGYDIFTVPSGGQSCPTVPNGNTYSGPPHLPFVVVVPPGTINYQTTSGIYTTLGNPGPSGGVIGPWLNLTGTNTVDNGYTDFYVKVQSPTGKYANFTLTHGTIVNRAVIHNV